MRPHIGKAGSTRQATRMEICALADDEFRMFVANSLDETAAALDALKQYA